MAKCFQELKLHNKFDFEVKFVVMDPGYSPENRKVIEDNAKASIFRSRFSRPIFSIRFIHVENSPCYLCARMRRGHLYHFAQQLGCNKIALGHHYDDVIETILMGMLYGAQVQTMMPKLHSIHFEGMELIRPLYLVREDDIKAWRDYNGLHFIQCACKFTDTCTTCNNEENRSKRVEIKELIKNLKKVNPFVESNIFRSVENVNIDTVVGYKQHGIRHNFLEGYDDNPGYVPEAEKSGGGDGIKRRNSMHRKIEETPEREKMLIRLKELRLERGYSMTQAARKIFSHPDTYNRYEKGIREIPLDSLMLLAKTYDCSLDYLAGVSDRPRKYGR